jgi:hypothetical protein
MFTRIAWLGSTSRIDAKLIKCEHSMRWANDWTS